MFDWKSTGANQGIAAQELGQVLNNWVKDSPALDAPVDTSDTTFETGGTAPSEMLRVSRDGFYVRGVRVAVDSDEAATVYRAFREWLTWAHMNRP